MGLSVWRRVTGFGGRRKECGAMTIVNDRPGTETRMQSVLTLTSPPAGQAFVVFVGEWERQGAGEAGLGLDEDVGQG